MSYASNLHELKKRVNPDELGAKVQGIREIEFEHLTPENVIRVMLKKEEFLEAISAFVETTLRQKKQEDNLTVRTS